MMQKTKLLILTTKEERSLNLLLLEEIDVTTKHYSDDLAKNTVLLTGFDIIYFRDPFTDEYDITILAAIVDTIHRQNPGAYFVDSVAELDDLLVEDKWKQYELFNDLMPNTELVNDFDRLDFEKQFVKKRISARARGVIFGVDEVKSSDLPQDFIAQEKLEIIEEVRVVTVRDKIYDMGVKKISKTFSEKVKLTDVVTVSDDMKRMARIVVSRLPELDITGIDIARTKNGELKLIEVNRSPQFVTFTKKTNINPFSELIQSLA